MLSFVKKIVLRVKKSLTNPNSTSELNNTAPPSWTPSPPPSYEDVVQEKRTEVVIFHEKAKILRQRARQAKYKYLYAESRYLHVKTELETMKYNQVRDVLEGKRRASDSGYATVTKILKEELYFLSSRRNRLRAEFLFIHNNLTKTREQLSILKSRYICDISRNSRPATIV